MVENNDSAAPKTDEKRFGCLQVFGFIVASAVIAAGATILIFKAYFFPAEFTPVTLKPQEEKVLATKLEKLDALGTDVRLPGKAMPGKPAGPGRSRIDTGTGTALEPEPYSETGLKREINFTERELNALLATNTDLAKKLAIDLSDDLVSAKLIVPVDEDFPVLGGKILRVRTGVVLAYDGGKPVVMLKGVTIMGVPLPNAWLGGIKNIDLVKEFKGDRGFWKAFSDGVENIKVEEGRLKITLKD